MRKKLLPIFQDLPTIHTTPETLLTCFLSYNYGINNSYHAIATDEAGHDYEMFIAPQAAALWGPSPIPELQLCKAHALRYGQVRDHNGYHEVFSADEATESDEANIQQLLRILRNFDKDASFHAVFVPPRKQLLELVKAVKKNANAPKRDAKPAVLFSVDADQRTLTVAHPEDPNTHITCSLKQVATTGLTRHAFYIYAKDIAPIDTIGLWNSFVRISLTPKSQAIVVKIHNHKTALYLSALHHNQ